MDEKDYGMIHDVFSWDRSLDADRVSMISGFQVFQGDPDPVAGSPHVLARSPAIALYERNFAEGGGENGLHSHDDEAIWIVLSGRATFFAAGGSPLGDLGPGAGVLVPAGTSYRFACSEPTSMMRVAAKPT